MENLIAKTIGFLRLQKPYKIVIKPKLKKGTRAEYYGMYRKGILDSHLLRVSVYGLDQDVRDFNTLIVHELIHAWQEENGIISVHGPEFQDKAAFLGYMLNMENIYIKDVDV